MIEQAEWEVGVVCTPTHIRKETVQALAAAGKHIFVEKPFADNYDEAQQMVRACEEANVTIAVNQNFRFHYPFDFANAFIREGKLGTVMGIAHQDLSFRQDSGWRIGAKRHVLSVIGVHWLDGFRWALSDEAGSIVAETRSSPMIDSVGETEAFVQILFEQGATASYVQSYSSPFRKRETLIIGEKGVLVLTQDGAEFFDHDSPTQPKEQWKNPYSGTQKPEATFRTLDELLTSLEQGTEPSNSGRDNLKTVALLDGVYRAAEEHRTVSLQEGAPA